MKTAVYKRPVFGKIFKRRLIIGLCIAAAVCALGVFVGSRIYHSYIRDAGDRNASDSWNYIHDLLMNFPDSRDNDEQAFGEMMNSIGESIVTSCEIDVFNESPYISTRLIRLDDMTVLADNRKLLYLSVREPDKEAEDETRLTYYLCHPDVYDEAYKTFMEYFEISNDADHTNSQRTSLPMISKAYIDGRYFYPCVSLGYNIVGTDNEYTPPKWTTEKSTEFYPADTSGMRFVENEKDSLSVWAHDKSPYGIDSEAEDTLDEFIRNTDPEELRDTDHYGCLMTNAYYIDMDEPEFAAGSYVLVMGWRYSFVGRFTGAVIGFTAGAFLLAVLIAFITSKLTYADRKAQYEIFSARQETTRAMAHDLKTPLTSITGYAELLQENIEPEKQKHYLEMISQNVAQMNTIVSDILELSKTESDTRSLDIEEVDIADLCRSITEGMSGAFGSAGLTCTVDEKEKTVVKADRRLMTQVLTNLIHNAVIYSKPGTSVDLTLTGKELTIVNIPDKMPEKSPEELLKPFVKGDEHRGSDTGSGVGLSIAKSGLERMGCRLSVSIYLEKFTAVCRF